MMPFLNGLSLIVKKKKRVEQNNHAFNVTKCVIYHNLNKSYKYNITSLQPGWLRIQMH